MAESERDSTEDWTLPASSRPPTLAALEQRVDHALAVAQASESAALEIGAAALDAAEQARRAAELAERAAAGRSSGPRVNGAAPRAEVAGAPGEGPGPVQGAPPPAAEPPPSDPLEHFAERADRLAARLGALAPVA